MGHASTGKVILIRLMNSFFCCNFTDNIQKKNYKVFKLEWLTPNIGRKVQISDNNIGYVNSMLIYKQNKSFIIDL